MRAQITARLKAAYAPEAERILGLAARLAAERGWQLYLNGGWVRDALLGIPNGDIDVSVVGDAHALAHLLAQETGGEAVAHGRFDTATLKVQSSKLDLNHERREGVEFKVQGGAPGGSALRTLDSPARSTFHIDLVTARRETYETPGALPTVEAGTIKDDLARRDFTINAMAVSITADGPGELLDPHGGLADLEAGLVRTLHARSFVDDPTRLIRAVRFAGRLGMGIEQGTLELMLQAVRGDALNTVSTGRAVRELMKVLEEPKAAAMLTRLQELGLLRAIHPQLHWPYPPPGPGIPEEGAITPGQRRDAYLAAIGAEFAGEQAGADKAAQLARSLGMTAPQVRLLHDAAALAQAWPKLGESGLTPSQVYNLLHPLDVNALEAYERIRALSADSVAWENLRYYLATARHTRPLLTGNYLKQLGVQPGPKYKRALTALLEARLDGKVNSRADEESFIQAWLARSES